MYVHTYIIYIYIIYYKLYILKYIACIYKYIYVLNCFSCVQLFATLWIVALFDCVDHNKLWKILKEMETTWPASWDICMQVRKQQLELDMEQQTGSK